MDNETENLSVAVEEPPAEAIREEIEETRSALTEKLETLEARVMGTVETVQSSVTDTVESVRDSVRTVKRNFDLQYQANERPWTVMGCSVLAGYVLGNLLPQEKGAGPVNVEGSSPAEPPWGPPSARRRARAANGTGVFHGLLSHFSDELATLQAGGIGVIMALARDQLKEKLPALAAHVEKAMDSATRKLGGDVSSR